MPRKLGRTRLKLGNYHYHIMVDCIHPDENNSGGNLKDYTLLVGPGYLC